MVPSRRRLLSTAATTALAGLAGCLDAVGDGPETATPGECTATPPPAPDTGEGLPDPRSYPDGRPDLTADAVADYVERFERAYAYNDTLAGLAADGHCLKYLETYVVGDETTVAADGPGFDVTVATSGSYTGASCPTAAGTETGTPIPHADFPTREAAYRVTRWSLAREGSVYRCW